MKSAKHNTAKADHETEVLNELKRLAGPTKRSLKQAKKLAKGDHFVLMQQPDGKWWSGHCLEDPAASGEGKTAGDCIDAIKADLAHDIAMAIDDADGDEKMAFYPRPVTLESIKRLNAISQGSGVSVADFVRTTLTAFS